MGELTKRRGGLLQARLIVGAAAVAAVASIGFRLNMNMASVGTLDLLIVVMVALHSGFWQASLLSVAAVACLDYFFIPPLFSLAIADPQSWVALATFQCTAVLVSRLSHDATSRAWTAEQRRRDMERLYDVSQQILLPGVSRDHFTSRIPQLIHRVFALKGVVFFDASTASIHPAGYVSTALEAGARESFIRDSDHFDEQHGRWFACVRIKGRPEGALALTGESMSGLVASALASLAALALESGRSFERESRAHSARQTERLRAAVLDGLAHEFKSPLTTIRAASSGLLEMRRLNATQRELVTLIDDETERLTQLTTSLLRTAALESQAIVMHARAVSVSDIIESVTAAMEPDFKERRIVVQYIGDDRGATADPDLCTSALTQLLENAHRYSYPESDIGINVYFTADEVIIAVTNQGTTIPMQDRDHIFERFYRSASMESVLSGTGIGLSVAKNLIEAQAGRIWVESNVSSGTTFYVSLPAATKSCERKT